MSAFDLWGKLMYSIREGTPYKFKDNLVSADVQLGWLELIVTPIGQPMKTKFLLTNAADHEDTWYDLDAKMIRQDLAVLDPPLIYRCRVRAMRCLAYYFVSMPQPTVLNLIEIMKSYLQGNNVFAVEMMTIMVDAIHSMFADHVTYIIF